MEIRHRILSKRVGAGIELQDGLFEVGVGGCDGRELVTPTRANSSSRSLKYRGSWRGFDESNSGAPRAPRAGIWEVAIMVGDGVG
ncbi:unnamed protein product, partial [Mycena citricolor]